VPRLAKTPAQLEALMQQASDAGDAEMVRAGGRAGMVRGTSPVCRRRRNYARVTGPGAEDGRFRLRYAAGEQASA